MFINFIYIITENTKHDINDIKLSDIGIIQSQLSFPYLIYPIIEYIKEKAHQRIDKQQNDMAKYCQNVNCEVIIVCFNINKYITTSLYVALMVVELLLVQNLYIFLQLLYLRNNDSLQFVLLHL